MFWTQSASGTIYSTGGLIGSERDGLVEFQGDKYGCEQFGQRHCGRNCGRGHVVVTRVTTTKSRCPNCGSSAWDHVGIRLDSNGESHDYDCATCRYRERVLVKPAVKR